MPVAPVIAFEEEQEAVELANDTEHGLVAYVYTRDLRRGMAVGEALETGMVGLNRGVVSDPAAPFGGVKESGVGQVNGQAGLRGYCHLHPMLVDRFGGKKVQGGYPYSRKELEGMKKFAKLLFGTRLGRWLG